MASNQDLDLLSRIAVDLRGDPDLQAYARYCELRSKGLRAAALKALSSFLADAADWPPMKRRAIGMKIANLMEPTHYGWQTLVPQPLLAGLVQPAVQQWALDEPTAAEPHVWLGLLSPGASSADDSDTHFRRALELDSACENARVYLVDGLLAGVNYNQHHLPDGYIGDPTADLTALEDADVLLAPLPEGERKAGLLEEVAEFRRKAFAYLRDAEGGRGRLRPV